MLGMLVMLCAFQVGSFTWLLVDAIREFISTIFQDSSSYALINAAVPHHTGIHSKLRHHLVLP